VDTHESSSTKPAVEIRIVGLNTDKTRRTLGSTTVYQVYFELSGTPPSAWSEIFGREWKAINTTQEAGIDGKFLVLHCPLQEIAATQLPALKKAVEATNAAFVRYSRDQASEGQRRAKVWSDERKIVEDIAKSLRFD
jgi:hypothetical protein